MEALAILIAIIVVLRLFIRWGARRSQDIHDYYSEGEDTATAETLLRTNEMRGNHL